MYKIKIILIIGLVACFEQALSLSCKNEQGKDVDWFVLLKPPKQKHTNARIADGSGYGYISSASKESGWQLADKEIGEVDSFIGQTLAETYQKPEEYSFVIYNDAKPEGFGSDSTTYAHAKGALVWNNKEAIWLIHSTPKFVPPFHSKKYEYPTTGKTHGQNFMCITVDPKKYVKPILDHLVTMKAQVYADHISKNSSPDIDKQVQEPINILAKRVKSNQGEPKEKLDKVDEARIKQLTTEIKTKGGESLTVFSKSRKDNVDIWSSIAAPGLKAKEYAIKFWTLLQKASALLPSVCTRQRIINVMDMDIQFSNAKDMKIDWGKNDHSKWGLCVNGGNNCYCAGDMNRATSQYVRGGGVVCMFNPKVHDTFQKSYKTQFGCSNKLENNPKK